MPEGKHSGEKGVELAQEGGDQLVCGVRSWIHRDAKAFAWAIAAAFAAGN